MIFSNLSILSDISSQQSYKQISSQNNSRKNNGPINDHMPKQENEYISSVLNLGNDNDNSFEKKPTYINGQNNSASRSQKIIKQPEKIQKIKRRFKNEDQEFNIKQWGIRKTKYGRKKEQSCIYSKNSHIQTLRCLKKIMKNLKYDLPKNNQKPSKQLKNIIQSQNQQIKNILTTVFQSHLIECELNKKNIKHQQKESNIKLISQLKNRFLSRLEKVTLNEQNS